MLVLMGVPLLLLAAHTSYIHTAVNGPEATILSYISELLNLEECQELYIRLAIPQKDAEQSSEEKDPFPSSQWQDISNTDQCKNSLTHWLEMQRGTVDWDRLARALRQIGRPDISRGLKKCLNKNRTMDPKWNVEKNQTAGAPRTAPLVEKKAPSQRSHHSPIQRYKKTALQKRSWEDQGTFFLKLFPFSLHNLSLQQSIYPLAFMFIVSFLAGLILWLISVYYVVCWSLGRSLFASGVHCDTNPGRQKINLTVICNHLANAKDRLDDQEDQSSSEDASDEDPCFQ